MQCPICKAEGVPVGIDYEKGRIYRCACGNEWSNEEQWLMQYVLVDGARPELRVLPCHRSQWDAIEEAYRDEVEQGRYDGTPQGLVLFIEEAVAEKKANGAI